MNEKRHKNELRAGIFVAIGIAVFTAAIFLLGQKSALFTRNTVLFVEFRDISGLAVGAPVRLSGLEVGTVSAISLSQDVQQRKTRVKLLVQTRYLPRIRADSEALIDSAGLLGDKVVNISLGSPEAQALGAGATLRTGQAVNFETLSSGLNHAVSSLTRIAGKVESIVGSDQTTQVQEDVARISASLANIMEQVERGDGLLHRVIYDPRYAQQVSATLSDVRVVADNARRASSRIDALMAQVEHGDGTMHALLYGSEGKDALVSLGRAADEIGAVVQAVRAEDGVLHALVYEPENKEFVAQLNQMAVTLNRMVQDVDQGRGSLGGLLRDPTVYEDLKSVLGNVKRNVLFKALVRFTAEREQLRRVDKVPSIELEGAPKPSPVSNGQPRKAQ